MNDRLDIKNAKGWYTDMVERHKKVLENVELLEAGYRRYEIARTMDPNQWKAAWALNLSTGKPFDEIIDDVGKFRNYMDRSNE